MNSKEIIALIAMLAVGLANGDSVFPNAGGDLASETDWGGPVPGASDVVTLDKSGTYTLSEDISIALLNLNAACTLNLGDHVLNIQNTSCSVVL